jgi:hypothetical protein
MSLALARICAACRSLALRNDQMLPSRHQTPALQIRSAEIAESSRFAMTPLRSTLLAPGLCRIKRSLLNN